MIIHIEDDFDLKKIADSGQCFRWEQTTENTYRIPHGTKCLSISALGSGSYSLTCSEDDFETIWQPYFDLQENYSSIRGMIDPKEDPFLAKAAAKEKGIRILRQDPWETLITFIISQNKNIPAIRRSVELLAEACGRQLRDDNGNRFYAFPEPGDILSLPGDTLKHCGLGYRCGYVHEAAKAVAEGKIDLDELRKTDEKSAIMTLTGLYGVGIKVASCAALFGLHHLNAFPKDVWVKRILENEYPNGYPFEKYSPYNGVFQQYMFAYYRENAYTG